MMRTAGPEYVHLLRAFPLLPLETEQDAAEAIRVRDWLDTRTGLSKAALQYKAVLEMTILDFDVRKLDEPDLPSAADMEPDTSGKVDEPMYRDIAPREYGMPPVAAHACTDDDPGEDEPEETADDVVVTVPDDDTDMPPAGRGPRKGRKR